MRVAIVENTRVTHHGQLGVALHEAAALIDIWRPWADGALPRPGTFDALAVLGGEQSALDDHSHPYLPDLAALMAEAAAAGTAVLGICLGSQILARGLGAENLLGAAPEFGWCEVRRRPEAVADPILGALPDRFGIFQWHSDTFTAPPGSAVLATSPAAPVQCFRVGRAGYGMQFHFEASRAVARDWLARFRPTIETLAPGWAERFDTLAAAEGAPADATGLRIARAWVALI
ncbi:MAG: type 1 glutamine amidotransferase [Paracoccaceae bacterium]